MFALNSNEDIPLYKQLYNQIRERVLSGQLCADFKLPSVRDLADELSVSRNTVDGAYQELYAEGYIYSKPRSGYFVSVLDHNAVLLPVSPKSRKSEYRVEPSTDYLYNFHPARLDRASFPAVLWRKCFIEILCESSRDLCGYSEPQGELDFRRLIQSYLERSRGVICSPEQIVICAGLQNSLDIVAQVLKSKHSTIAVENPGFFLPRSVFSNHSYKIVPTPVGPGGIDLEHLKAGNSTIAYVTPSHQLPLGCVMQVANRLMLIEWAEANGNFIIEDDYDSELRYHGKPIPSLQGLRPNGNIIYLGTFSKILSPALRISYLVLPYSLLATYRRLFGDYCSQVSLLEQRTLAKFMELGHWDRYVRKTRTLYNKKHDTLLRAIECHFGNRAIVVGQGAGLHVVLNLPYTQLNEAEIIKKAQQQRIYLNPFRKNFASGEPESTNLMLGFGGMTVEEIEQGVALLSQICF